MLLELKTLKINQELTKIQKMLSWENIKMKLQNWENNCLSSLQVLIHLKSWSKKVSLVTKTSLPRLFKLKIKKRWESLKKSLKEKNWKSSKKLNKKNSKSKIKLIFNKKRKISFWKKSEREKKLKKRQKLNNKSSFLDFKRWRTKCWLVLKLLK